MAGIQPGRSSRRPHSLRGAVVLLVKKGKIIAQSWPNKRGRSPHSYQRAQIDRIRALQRNVYNVPAEERSLLQRALKKFLDANRGVRGTAAIRERDFLTSNMAGRLYRPQAPQGRPLNTAAIHGDASDILDWLEPRMGGMIVRTSNGWLTTVNCGPGRVLTMTEETQETFCCPNASIAPKHLAMGGHD